MLEIGNVRAGRLRHFFIAIKFGLLFQSLDFKLFHLDFVVHIIVGNFLKIVVKLHAIYANLVSS